MSMQKGANIPRTRNALGRGLTALMSASQVAVPLMPQHKSGGSGEALSQSLEIDKTEFNRALNAERLASATATTEILEDGLLWLETSRLVAGSGQPRQNFDQSEIAKLSESIKKSGVLQPILVRRLETGPKGNFEIIAGERRFRAAQLAGLEKVPVILKHITDREALELGIIENVQRADLNPIEEALAYQRLANEFSASQSEIAETVGKDRASVANALRLLKLAKEVQDKLVKGSISAGHARALLGLEQAEKQLQLAQKIEAERLSVRETEELVNSLKTGLLKDLQPATSEQPASKRSSSRSKTKAEISLEDRLRRALGTKVRVSIQEDAQGVRGEIRLSFYAKPDLERIIERLESR